jgi:hypothetical protein
MMCAAKLVIACLVVVLLFPATALADQTEEANRLIDQVNALLPEDSSQYAELTDLLAKVDQIDPSSKKAAAAVAYLTDASALLDEMVPRMESIAALTDEAAALDVSPEVKAYMAQMQDLARLNLQLYAVWGDMLAKYETAYRGWNQLSATEQGQLVTDVNDLASQIDAVAAQTQENDAAARRYFEQHKLDEPPASSGFHVPPILWLGAIGAGAYFLGRWYRRRKLRRAVAGT